MLYPVLLFDQIESIRKTLYPADQDAHLGRGISLFYLSSPHYLCKMEQQKKLKALEYIIIDSVVVRALFC